MKRFYAFVVVAALMVGAAAVYAGDGCCAGMSKSAKGAACSDMLSKLKLTDEQKARVETLKEQCHTATSTSERREMMTKGMESILTPDQFAQWKSACDKAMSSGACPAMKSSECPMKSGQKS